MALLNTYVQTYAQVGKFLEAIQNGQAPDKFTRQYLKDLGFKSSNHHPFIPLLKGLGFLTADGTPTDRYKAYLDKSRSRRVLGEAIRDAYSDVFTIRSQPRKEDRSAIAGKFKSTFNMSNNTAELAARTFLALLDHADTTASDAQPHKEKPTPADEKPKPSASHEEFAQKTQNNGVGLHYNIQIHLPPSKDVEVYNAIFKSLREHLLD